MNLHALVKVLTDDGLVAGFEPANEEFDADRVDVELDIEGFADPLTLQITQIEVEPDNMSGFELIQIYAPIPLELDEESVGDVIGVLPDVNQAVPLIGFNVHPEDSFVYFRHVMLSPKDQIGRQMITQAVWLSHFALDTFALRFAAFAQSESN